METFLIISSQILIKIIKYKLFDTSRRYDFNVSNWVKNYNNIPQNIMADYQFFQFKLVVKNKFLINLIVLIKVTSMVIHFKPKKNLMLS